MATPKKLAKQRKKGVSPKSASDLAGRLTQAVNDQSISALQATEKPELVFGLVGPIGVDLEPIITAITQSISVAGYEVIPIHLSKLIGEVFDLDTKGKPEDERIELLMRAGTLLRKKSGLGEAVALLGVSEIADMRRAKRNNEEAGTAFILRSLKHPEEVEKLRAIYGRGFILISVYSPRDVRVAALADRITRSKFSDKNNSRARAEGLVEIDESEESTPLGQDVRDAFPLADFFVDGRNVDVIRKEVRRFLHLLLGNRFLTPTRDEHGMYLARSAALRSADLNRQVGAAIVRDRGEVLTIGCNDVPKAGGDQYWEDDVHDARDFKRGMDSSAQQKVLVLSELLSRLKKADLLVEKDITTEIGKLVESLISGELASVLKGSSIVNLLEFGRSVHAEMAAITSAARLGISIEGATIYCTTFPCHMCARHIVASGIKKVVYVEPYPKSRAEQLHADSIAIDPLATTEEHVNFVPFKGVAPRQYQNIFDAGDLRKNARGQVADWKMTTGNVRFQRYMNTYRAIEAKIDLDAIPLLKNIGILFRSELLQTYKSRKS